MKKLFVMAAMMLSLCANAQIVKKGNTFYVESRTTVDTIVTQYKYGDKTGEYPVIIRKDSGRCWVWKRSTKSGRMYKMYLTGKREDIARRIAKEYGITYKEVQKRK